MTDDRWKPGLASVVRHPSSVIRHPSSVKRKSPLISEEAFDVWEDNMEEIEVS